MDFSDFFAAQPAQGKNNPQGKSNQHDPKSKPSAKQTSNAGMNDLDPFAALSITSPPSSASNVSSGSNDSVGLQRVPSNVSSGGGRRGQKTGDKVSGAALDLSAFSKLAEDHKREEKKDLNKLKKTGRRHRDEESESDDENAVDKNKNKEEVSSEEEEEAMCSHSKCHKKAVLESKCLDHLKEAEEKKGAQVQKGQWSVNLIRGETKYKLARNLVEWKFVFRGVQHCVEFHHSTFSGKKTAYVDGARVMSSKKILTVGSMARLPITIAQEDGSRMDLEIVIKDQAVAHTYDLSIQGVSFKQAMYNAQRSV